MKKDILFITGNKHKFEVAQNFFKNHKANDYFNLIQHDVSPPEIQSDSIEEIALYSAQWSFDKIKKPVIKSDAGLYIEVLNGFPGPFMKYVNSWFSQDDFLALLKDKENRNVVFKDALAFVFNDIEKTFVSDTLGTIAENSTDTEGYPVDQLFIPKGKSVSLVSLSKKDRIEVWNTDRWDSMLNYLIKNYDKF